MVNCHDCKNDVTTRFRLNIEYEVADDEDFGGTINDEEKLLCSLCLTKRLQVPPQVGLTTRRLMKTVGIDPQKVIRDGITDWSKKALGEMIEGDLNNIDPSTIKLREGAKHLAFSKPETSQAPMPVE